MGMRGTANRASAGGVGSDNTIVIKNCWRQQSTRGEAEGKVDNHRKNDRADDACQHGAEVDCNCCDRAGGESDDADDDCGLHHRFGLDFKGKFHAPEQWQVPRKTEELEEEGGEGPLTKGRNSGTVPTVEVTATAPPWFLVRAQKPTGEEVSVRLLLLALLEDQGQTNTGGKISCYPYSQCKKKGARPRGNKFDVFREASNI